MRWIIFYFGVVQGRGGLVLGSVIPCALFYFFQLYLKHWQRSHSQSPPPEPAESGEASPLLTRVQSRSILTPRGTSGPAQVSSRANLIAKEADNPCYVGLKRFSENPFDELNNHSDGIFQLRLVENKLSLDLVQDWLSENGDSILSRDVSGIATYQPFDGLMELKVVNVFIMLSALDD